MAYYRILFLEEEHLGVGHTTIQKELFFLPDAGKVENWKPIVLELKDGGYPDYLASNLGCRLCSERLKAILADNASPSDVLEWLEVVVKSGSMARPYFILHFPEPADVLDRNESTLVDDFVVKPVLADAAAKGHHVFAYPKCGCLPLFVSDNVRRKILTANCTGIEFSRLPVVPPENDSHD